ncbi:MAG: helix-turn-helix domain-containing protein [Cyanobacteriota bacterium]
MGQTLRTNDQQELVPSLGSPPIRAIEHHHLPDAESVYRHLNQAGQLKSFQPLGQNCQQLAGQMEINGVTLLSYCGSGAKFVVEARPLVSLVATFSGAFAVRDSTGKVKACTGESLLVSTGSGARHYSSTTDASGAALFMEPAAIRRTAAAIAGWEPEQALEGAEEPPLPLRAMTPLDSKYLFALLEHIDACAAVDPHLPIRLGLDDLILRQVACMLQPELLEAAHPQSSSSQDRRSRQTIDELLDYIRANLDQPLRLSDLEARSFHSRRALQDAFWDKLNTPPMQWIREQRLTRAKERLEREGSTLSIRAVALSCGYRQMGQFSWDFKRRFDLTPFEASRPSQR